jgi:hypothetical protein
VPRRGRPRARVRRAPDHGRPAAGFPAALSNLVCSFNNFTAFAARHWPSLVWQGVFLSVAFLVFDLGAEQGIGGLLPEAARQAYLAVLLFVKNPTVIAFTIVWWIGLIRQTAVSRPAPVG